MWEFNFGSCSGKWIATFKTVILVEGSCLLFVLWVSATCCFPWEVLKGTEGIRASVDSLWGRLDHKDILCECVVCVCVVCCACLRLCHSLVCGYRCSLRWRVQPCCVACKGAFVGFHIPHPAKKRQQLMPYDRTPCATRNRLGIQRPMEWNPMGQFG